jgi:putative membrane protein
LIHELIDWLVAILFFPSECIAYLGSQGDIWDTQKDMGIAFLGSILMVMDIDVMRKYFLKKTKEEI